MTEKTFVFNDEAVRNSYGFRIRTSGISLERFNTNPVCLNNHINDTKNVLGTWKNIVKDNALLTGVPVFDTEDVDGKEVVRKVGKGTIKACSMGITLEPEHLVMYENGDLVLEACELFECSIIPVPSNSNSLAFFSADGKTLTEREVKNITLSAIQSPNVPKPENHMKLILSHLQLAETASETEILAAVKGIELRLTNAIKERDTLKDKLEKKEAKELATLKENFIAELASAVKDGRIDATTTKPKFEALFAEKPAEGVELLQSLPRHQSVSEQLEGEDKTLAEYDKMTFGELDKKNLLPELKEKYPDYYAERYEKQHGRKPKK